MGARFVRWCAVVVAASLCAAGGARAAFPQDPPNDPAYDAQGPTCIDGKQYELFDSLPSCAPTATDPEGASGLSVDRAWRDFSTGNPETVIAYVEAGINWRDPNAVEELANKVYLNAGELPKPTTPAKGDADCGTGVLCAADFSDTGDANGNGDVDPEDLIVRYSDGRDDDGNGYPDDISGWDFYNDQNDPATNDSSYAHANNQMERVAGQTDNATAGAAVCPRCRVLPIKAGAEALDRTDDLAESWLDAVDAGASVIVSVTADLGYSTFMRQTAEYVSRKGVVAVAASNDFDSTDHQGGMFHPHVLPGNGMVANRLNFGPLSKAARDGKIPRALTAQEVVQVMKATASDVNDPSLAWPTRPAGTSSSATAGPTSPRRCRRSRRATSHRRRSSTPPTGSTTRIQAPHRACGWRAASTPPDRAATRGSSRPGWAASPPTPTSLRWRAAAEARRERVTSARSTWPGSRQSPRRPGSASPSGRSWSRPSATR
nr:hypothetical protein [Actinomycetota bacterium]